MEKHADEAERNGADATHQVLRIHVAWAKLIELCHEIGYGELERVKIQDGLPVVAEVTTRRIKFL